MVYAVTTQTVPSRSSLSHCHKFHGTRVNAILLTTVIKVRSSLSADLLYRISQNSVGRYGKYGYTFIYALSAAFLTASMFRNAHSTFLWITPTPNFIQNERKCRNCEGKNHLRPYVRNGSHGTKFEETQLLNGMRLRSPIPHINRLLDKNVANTGRNSRKHDCQ